MPFNQLVLPLLGGYVFINQAYITSYWSSRHSREHLIFLSAVAGAFLLVLSRLIAWLLTHFSIGRELAFDIHRTAPFDGIGTAIGAFLLGFVLRFWFNRAWNIKKASLWHYAKGSFNQMEALFFSSTLDSEPDEYFKKHPWRVLVKGLLGWYRIRIWIPRAYARLSVLRAKFSKAESYRQNSAETEARYNGDEERITDVSDGPPPVMLFLKNRKVYVGYILFVMPVRAEAISYITMIPAWSGYRDATTLEVVPTYNYNSTITGLEKHVPAEYFAKVFCLSDIEAASLYDENAFLKFVKDTDAQGVKVENRSSID